MGGHVCAPLVGTMRKEGWPIPEGFNARTKLTPDWSKVEAQMKEELEKIEEEVRRKCSCESNERRAGAKLGAGINWEELKNEYERLVDQCEGGVRESTAEKFGERLEGFVVAPVDKYTQEMAIL